MCYIIDYNNINGGISHASCKGSHLVAYIEAIQEEHGNDCIIGVTKL